MNHETLIKNYRNAEDCTKKYLVDLVHQIRIGISPECTFECLDILEVTFRAQNETMCLAENNKLSGNDIANAIMAKSYLYRF